MTEIVEQSKELAIMENLTPDIFAGDALDKALAKMRADALSVVGDVTTKKGRDEITSRAHRLRRSKAPITDLGKKVNEEKKAEIKAISEKCESAVKEIDSIIAEVRKPLDEYEAIELTRTTGHENALSELVRIRLYDMTTTSEQIAAKMEESKAAYGARDWQEYAEKAHAQTLTNLETLDAAFKVIKQREDDQAELKRLKEIEAKRKAEQDERDRINAIENPQPVKTEFPEQPIFCGGGPTVVTLPLGTGMIFEVKGQIANAEEVEAKIQERADTQNGLAELRRQIRGEILDAMKSVTLVDEESLKKVIIAIANGKIPHLQINYGE